MSANEVSDRDRRFADALTENAGNASAAARVIGISPSRGRELRQKPAIKKYVDDRLAELQSHRTKDLVLSRELVEQKTLDLLEASLIKGSLVAAASSLSIAERLTREKAGQKEYPRTWEEIILEVNNKIKNLPPDEKLEFVASCALNDLGVTTPGDNDVVELLIELLIKKQAIRLANAQ